MRAGPSRPCSPVLAAMPGWSWWSAVLVSSWGRVVAVYGEEGPVGRSVFSWPCGLSSGRFDHAVM
jgi:hypothetical protein